MQALCYCNTCTYHWTVRCRFCVIVIHVLNTGLCDAGFVLLLYMYLPLDCAMQALCYCPCTYHRTGCCSFVLLLHMYLPQDWVLQALCYYRPCTYNRTGCCRLGWHCPCCLRWCHRHSCRPHWLELDCCRVGFVSACPLHTSHCRYSRCSRYPSSRSLAQL